MMIEDEELRNLYQISGEERLQKLDAGLLHLQQHPDDATILEELQREAHSLKGDSRSLGVEPVELLADKIEEILLSLKRQQTILTPQVSDRLHQGLEVMHRLVQEAVSDQPHSIDWPRILQDLQEAVSGSKPLPPEILPYPEEEQNRELALHLSVDNGNHSTTPTAIAETDDDPDPFDSAPILLDDEALRTLYQSSSEERLQKLEAGLLHLQNHPDDQTPLEDLQREAHSLKGDSGSVGVESVELLAEQVEEIFFSLKHQQISVTPQLLARLHQGLIAIKALVQEAVTGQPSDIDLVEILDELRDIVSPSPETNQTPQLPPTFIEDEEFREIYKIASEERLQKLEAGLLQLEKHPDDEATLDQLLREAHSLKGDSRSAGIEPIETLTHQVEEILGNLKYRQTILTPQISDRLYQGLDAISKLVDEAVTGKPSDVNTAQVLEQLMAVVVTPTIPPLESAFSEEILHRSREEEDREINSPPSPSPGMNEPYRIDTIRVQTRDLDTLIAQAEELTVTKIRIAHATAELEELATLWEEWKAVSRQRNNLDALAVGINPYEERLEKMLNALKTSTQDNSTRLDLIAGELRENIRTLRLLPLSTLFQLFPRMVRDLARQQSKEVELIIEGGETTADKRILEDIKDSLMHMIRNAIDHGIETPAEREKLGKPPGAKIWLRGYQRENKIIIEVADDGRGLDIEAIKQTAIKRKLYRQDDLDRMTPSQIHALIFAPGFSTRTFITEISGRGIGLDVVHHNIERLKGTIQIESTPHQGSTFRLQLSTTLATLNALLIKVEGILHALPIEFVQTSILVSEDEISRIDGQESITFDGQVIPVVNLVDLLELSNSPAYKSTAKLEHQTSDLRPCILLKLGNEQAGFFVNSLLDNQEVVIKPQSQLLKRVRNVSGATILPTGDVCMILNPLDLFKSLHQKTASIVSIKPREIIPRRPVILLVEDSIPVRTQEKRLFERAGYEVVIAVNGLEGYNKLKTRHFDAVVSDVEMPYLDGFSLTAKIRQHQEYDDLPIILVTTLDSDEDKKRGANAGANAYILKGKFNQDVLLETVGRLV